MTEADEVATTLLHSYTAHVRATGKNSMDSARSFVRDMLPDESEELIDNIAESLRAQRTLAERAVS